MNRTSIEWVKNPDGSQGYTWNPITGCLNHDNGLCKGGGFPCYAYKLANGRLKPLYLANLDGIYMPASMKSVIVEASKDPFYPRFWENRIDAASGVMPKAFYKGGWAYQNRGIFVCDMGDLFGIGIPEEWTRKVLDICKFNLNHRFYLRTKQPQNLPKFSPFPENCWVGVTATNTEMLMQACSKLEYPLKAKLKYISLEPLLQWGFHWEHSYLVNTLKRADIHWLIIGAMTSQDHWELEAFNYHHDSQLKLRKWGKRWTLQPKIEWVEEIVEAADQAGIPVFLKDNLEPIIPQSRPFRRFPGGLLGDLRQEMPETERIPQNSHIVQC